MVLHTQINSEIVLFCSNHHNHTMLVNHIIQAS